MFGYATDETEECMPLTVVLAHGLNKKIADMRRDGTFSWARPGTKTQVTIEYEYDYGASHVKPIRVHTIVVSCQHSDEVGLESLRQEIIDKVKKTLRKVRFEICILRKLQFPEIFVLMSFSKMNQ